MGERFEAARADLAEQGYCLIEGVLDGEQLAEIQDSLHRLARFDRESGWVRDYGFGNDATANQRIWNLISRDPIFARLVEHPTALDFVRGVIGWPALLSSTSANVVVADDDNIAVHADMAYMPEPWAKPHGVNIAWFIDDFTAENGATLARPGSHHLNRDWREADGLDGFIPVEGKAGTMLVMDGRLWHSTGRNRSGKPRAGIFNWYTLPIYLPQENWFLSLNPALRQFGSDELLTLLGFKPGLMGRVNGQQPGRL